MSIEAEPCRVVQLRDRAARTQELVDQATDNEHLKRAVKEFRRQAAEAPCECGHCGDDEG